MVSCESTEFCGLFVHSGQRGAAYLAVAFTLCGGAVESVRYGVSVSKVGQPMCVIDFEID